MVDISQIRRDGGTQSRVKIDESTVAEYAEAMSDPNTVFPPVIVYYDGTDYWLADGFHRIAAWARIGRSDIPAEIRQEDRRRAILHSLRANTTHGLRRSNEDKRHSVKMLLEDEEWSQWSNREIARMCAVSDHLVAEIRTSLTAFSCSEDPNEVRTYTTRHGNTAKMRVAKIGAVKKEKASEHPEEATHNVASRADVEASASPTPERDAPVQPTRDASEMDVIRLRDELAEANAQIRAQVAEIEKLKAQLKDALSSDSGTVISRLSSERDQEEREKWKAVEEQSRLQKVVDGLQKRVTELEYLQVPQ